MSLRNDSAKREILLALVASKLPQDVRELSASTGRSPSETLEALDDLAREFIILSDEARYSTNELVLRTARVLARGLHPLDRHITEAIALRDGDSPQTQKDT